PRPPGTVHEADGLRPLVRVEPVARHDRYSRGAGHSVHQIQIRTDRPRDQRAPRTLSDGELVTGPQEHELVLVERGCRPGRCSTAERTVQQVGVDLVRAASGPAGPARPGARRRWSGGYRLVGWLRELEPLPCGSVILGPQGEGNSCFVAPVRGDLDVVHRR